MGGKIVSIDRRMSSHPRRKSGCLLCDCIPTTAHDIERMNAFAVCNECYIRFVWQEVFEHNRYKQTGDTAKLHSFCKNGMIYTFKTPVEFHYEESKDEDGITYAYLEATNLGEFGHTYCAASANGFEDCMQNICGTFAFVYQDYRVFQEGDLEGYSEEANAMRAWLRDYVNVKELTYEEIEADPRFVHYLSSKRKRTCSIV